MAIDVEDSTRRDTDFGLGLRERLEREHERRTDAQLEAISPELVLVLPVELAELARSLLPDLPAERPPPAVRPATLPAEKPLSRERAAVEVAAFGLFCIAATVGPLLLLILARS